MSVYCDWVRWKVWSATCISVWQHVKLSEQIRPWDTLACCWDVKQPTNNNLFPSSVCSTSMISKWSARQQEWNQIAGNTLLWGRPSVFTHLLRADKQESNDITTEYPKQLYNNWIPKTTKKRKKKVNQLVTCLWENAVASPFGCLPTCPIVCVLCQGLVWGYCHQHMIACN